MPVAYFRVPLTVKPKTGGEAELAAPKVVQNSNYHFVIVADGGKEGIIQVEDSQAAIKKIEQAASCHKLTAKQVETARQEYAQPKLKQKYQLAQLQASDAESAPAGQFELDANGDKIINTFQTVRSGFYLIDVPIVTTPGARQPAE